jgi:hypothetical protein
MMNDSICGNPFFTTVSNINEPEEIAKIRVGLPSQIPSIGKAKNRFTPSSNHPASTLKKIGRTAYLSVTTLIAIIITLIFALILFGVASRIHNAACGSQVALSENC